MRTQYTTESFISFSAISVVAILTTALWSLIMAWPIQLLWNWVAPAIFGLGRITLFQAFGLKLLLSLTLGRVSFNENPKGHS